MKSKFVKLFQNYNFVFHKIIVIQLCLRLQEFIHLIKFASYVYLTLPEVQKSVGFENMQDKLMLTVCKVSIWPSLSGPEFRFHLFFSPQIWAIKKT